MFVGNVICNASLATGFPTGSTGLKFQFFAPSLQGWKAFFGPAGQVTMDRGPRKEKLDFLSRNEFILKIFGSSDATPNIEFTNLENFFMRFSFNIHKLRITKKKCKKSKNSFVSFFGFVDLRSGV